MAIAAQSVVFGYNEQDNARIWNKWGRKAPIYYFQHLHDFIDDVLKLLYRPPIF